MVAMVRSGGNHSKSVLNLRVIIIRLGSIRIKAKILLERLGIESEATNSKPIAVTLSQDNF